MVIDGGAMGDTGVVVVEGSSVRFCAGQKATWYDVT
jgi:hypothetical protein